MSVAEDAMRELAGLAIRPDGWVGSSDLGVAELLLVREAGFTPIMIVSASAVAHIGWQRRRWTESHELTALTRGLTACRAAAVADLLAQALSCGADGVVGVRLTVGSHEWGPATTEFVATGTAVLALAATPGPAGGWHVRGRPFTSALSGQELWGLLRAGHAPSGLVLGSCVMQVARRGPVETLSALTRNVELPAYTKALYDARERALARMQQEAHALGAVGIVGVQLVLGGHRSGAHTEEFLATGTAVRPVAGGGDPATPQLVLELDS